jgi:hypothetical protein
MLKAVCYNPYFYFSYVACAGPRLFTTLRQDVHFRVWTPYLYRITMLLIRLSCTYALASVSIECCLQKKYFGRENHVKFRQMIGIPPLVFTSNNEINTVVDERSKPRERDVWYETFHSLSLNMHVSSLQEWLVSG